MKLTTVILFFTITLFSISLSAQNMPFPQSKTWNGAIKPNHKTQAELNLAVSNLYDQWKTDFLKPTIMEGGYYVEGECTGCVVESKGTSEGHGYGMIITALMAGYDANAKQYFDGLYKFFDNYRSIINNELMNWNVAVDEREPWTDSATDGDFDIAYSLLLAHYQWGSDGDIDYLQESIDMINDGLKLGDMSTVSKRVMLGDWDNNMYTTRPSDWMTDHFRAYYNATGDNFWLDAADTVYSMMNVIIDNYSSNTGLMPDFVVGETARPSNPNFLEGENDGDYYYNACRFPWRISSDYLHYGTAESKQVLSKFLEWANDEINNDFANYTAGYELNGTALNSYDDLAFIAPLVLAFTTDEGYQNTLNDGWDYIEETYWGYYDASINLLCQLMITGNWWSLSDGYFNKENEIGGKIIGYFPSWSGSVSNIQFDKLTHVNYSFLLPKADGTLKPIENETKLNQLVAAAHNEYSKVLIAIGGWNNGDDSAFETIAADEQLTITFVSNVMAFVREHNLDGVDMDWEYPDSGQSAANYVSMMTVFADSLHSNNKMLTAAVVGKEWDINSIRDSIFSLVDWLNIMAYDNFSQDNHSTFLFATSCLNYWQNTRELPKEKTVLGVPFYGYSPYASYRSIVSQHPDAPYTDHVGNYYYNGKNTMHNKTLMAKERCAGTMIWEISQDTYEQETSLLTVIYESYKGIYTGVVEKNELNLKLYPNPATNIVTIELPVNTKLVHIHIFDQSGRLIKNINFNKNQNKVVFSVKDLDKGIYLIDIVGKDNHKIVKFIKL